MKYLLPILFLGILFSNCNKDNERLSYDAQLEVDSKIIADYLAANNLTAEEGQLGMRYIIEEPGEGANPTAASTVIVKYKGYFPDGTVFDEADAFQTPLQSTIAGWIVGIPLFKKGGKGRLFLPSSLGYGEFGTRGIDGNQVIFFDIELINFL